MKTCSIGKKELKKKKGEKEKTFTLEQPKYQ